MIFMEIQLKFVTNCRGENDMEFNWLNKSEMEVEENKTTYGDPKDFLLKKNIRSDDDDEGEEGYRGKTLSRGKKKV